MEKRREVYREEGRSKGQETEKKVGLEERREGGKGEERQSGRKKSHMLTTRSRKPKPTAHSALTIIVKRHRKRNPEFQRSNNSRVTIEPWLYNNTE